MNSVQRMFEIVDLKPEGQHKMPKDELLNGWPSKGQISFVDVSMKYRANTDLVLKKMNLEILPGQRVGCVGRTGAGKSSILQALFRMTEIENTR